MNPVTFKVNDVVVIKYAQKYWIRLIGVGKYCQDDLDDYNGEIGLIQKHRSGHLFIELQHPSGGIAHYHPHRFDFDKIGVL